MAAVAAGVPAARVASVEQEAMVAQADWEAPEEKAEQVACKEALSKVGVSVGGV